MGKNQELKAIQLENEAGCLRPSIKDTKKLEITSLARIYAKVFGNYVEAFESDIIKVKSSHCPNFHFPCYQHQSGSTSIQAWSTNTWDKKEELKPIMQQQKEVLDKRQSKQPMVTSDNIP